MAMNFLEFEQPIAELEAKIEELDAVVAQLYGLTPYDSPHIQTAPNTFVNSGCCSSMVPKHSISGRNRLSGMVGIRS